jgi:osmotically-inducible protein OsmY
MTDGAIPFERCERAPVSEMPDPAGSRAAKAPSTEGIIHGAVGFPSGDELTHQDICATLLAAKDLHAQHIEVEMTGAGVLLRGSVPTAAERERALGIAKAKAGWRVVREALAVQTSAAHHPVEQ